jgi:DNA-binding YbaB/EbfC family protein
MTGAFGELGSLLKQAQQMQRELERAREELKRRTVEGRSRDDLVKVVVSGDRRVLEIEIAPAALQHKDAAALEDLILAAVRDGQDKAVAVSAEVLGKVTGGINLPGLF